MPRCALCIALVCIFGACATDTHENVEKDGSSGSSKETCRCPQLYKQFGAAPPSEYVCNNATFDWMMQTLVTKIAQLTDVLQQKEEQIIHINQTWEKQSETYKEYIGELQQRHDGEIQHLRALHARANIKPHDCADVLSYGYHYSGIYVIYPIYRIPRTDHADWPGDDVMCDMDTDGGGWLLIQRRRYGSESFRRTWHEYKLGFGQLTGDFWLGNERMYAITQQRDYALRIDMTHYNGSHFYAHYDHFRLEPEANNYKLHLGKYHGTAGDAMAYHNQQDFSTKDRDHDLSRSGNCAQLYGGGGWWYASCYDSNLNGLYTTNHGKQGIIWYTLDYSHAPLRHVEMKIRPKNFINSHK